MWLIAMLLFAAVVPLALLAISALLVRRWRPRPTVFVPGLVSALAIADLALFSTGMAAISSQDPATKGTVLSLGISEGVNAAAFLAVIAVPLLLLGWLVDRRLRRNTPQ